MSEASVKKLQEKAEKEIKNVNEDTKLTASQKESRIQLIKDTLAAELKADEENETRSGVGTRQMVGATRGRNTSVITYENFDESQPATLPKTLKEFLEVTKVKDSELVDLLITGYNEAQYKLASDEIGEFVDKTWPDDVQMQFRMVVRNYAKATGQTIEQAVAVIKPGIVAAQSASK